MKIKKTMYTMFFVICIAMFFVSAFFLVKDLSQRFSANKEYETLRELNSQAKDTPFLINQSVDLLKEKNSQTVGRIIIDDTNIDYPIVKGTDNSHYLYYSFLGEVNSSGCIFMDYRNTGDFSDSQTIIYGHKMKTGTMFNNLKKFKTSSFMAKKPKITVYTTKTTLVYEALYTVITTKSEEFITLDLTNESLLKKCAASCVTKTNNTAGDSDKLLILFTCDGDDEDSREIVVAKLISETPVK